MISKFGGLAIVGAIVALVLSYPASATGESEATPRSYIFLRGKYGPVTRDVEEIDRRRQWMHEIGQDWLPLDILTAEQRNRAFDGRADLILTVDADGSVTGCDMIRSDFSSEQDGAICGFLTRPARFERRYLEPGKPVAWQSNFVVSASTIIPVKNVPPVPPPAPVFFRSGPEAWPRLFYGDNLYVASFPRLADSLPRGVKAKGRTAVDVTIESETGIAKCEVVHGSGVATLDDRACVAARLLGFRYVRLTPGGEQDVLPLLFVWDGKRSHIRVPLPSERLAPLAQLDPLDPRERRLQRLQARPPADLAIPSQALNGVILFPTLYRQPWATIEFDETGRVTRCQLTISTGDQDVDRALCTYIETAWRFDPGEDIFGDPVAGRWSGAISF